MNRNQIRTRTAGVTPERERRYQVWVGGCFTGTVDAANPQDARAHAARIFMVALRDVSVLPPY